MHSLLTRPYNAEIIIRKKRKIKREFLADGMNRTPCRIAILGGSTTTLLKDITELFLLDSGIKPTFYESEYNKWYEDSVFDNDELTQFNPQFAYIHISSANITNFPESGATDEEINWQAQAIIDKLKNAWYSLKNKYHCAVIQNNFELPSSRLYGNFDFVNQSGRVSFINEINRRLATVVANYGDGIYIQDINFLSSKIGLDNWYSWHDYLLYKNIFTDVATVELAQNFAVMMGAALGKSRKCLVLDLDNTLWGGVIGEDGTDNLRLGEESAVGEGFCRWQDYVLRLKQRGILLAVCSKNDEEIAKSGLAHPDCRLRVEDFACFVANWHNKADNMIKIAEEINIGLDSFVFIDDNPVERQLIRERLPMVAVPEVIGEDPLSYIEAIENGKYFETLNISDEDIRRTDTYKANVARNELIKNTASYDDFLRRLDMNAEISPFKDVYIRRIAQLTNKTNQFNLTTLRCTEDEIRRYAKEPKYLTLYGRLTDTFGDNGLVSVMVGERRETEIHIILFLMSCRVLKREMEHAMMSVFLHNAEGTGCKEVVGYYYPTLKNGMVENLYSNMGFTEARSENGSCVWRLSLCKNNTEETKFPGKITDDNGVVYQWT